MKIAAGLRFNDFLLDGWHCSCGEIYFNPEQAQKALLKNQLMKKSIKVRLGKIRSNLILRLPTSVEHALSLKKGEEVTLKMEEKGLRIVLAQ